jgi:hypothetical protein
MDYLNFKPRTKTGFYAQSFLEQIILCLGEINGYFIFITRSWVGAYADYCEFNEGEADQSAAGNFYDSTLTGNYLYRDCSTYV